MPGANTFPFDYNKFFFSLFKVSLNLILSDFSCKDGIARFNVFVSLSCLFSFAGSCTFFLLICNREAYRNKQLSSQKNDFFFRIFDLIWVFKGTVVNRASSSLNGGTLEISLTVPLTAYFLFRRLVKRKQVEE